MIARTYTNPLVGAVDVSRCESQPEDPVCDTRGRRHRNPCTLLRSGAELLHRGPCAGPVLADQEDHGGQVVCGADGSPYPSRAAALAARVPVDYPGPCGSADGSEDCDLGRCPPLAAGCLRGSVPAGACCPVCAGVLHAAVNSKALDRALLAVNKLPRPWPQPHRAVSLQALLLQLQRQVRSRRVGAIH